jgi:DHA2 family multidrug resistance protein-like MFS transporter
VAGETLDSARATLGGAVAAAELHPSPHMAAFLAAARDAFMSGLHAVALLSIGGMLLCAALAFRHLRKARPASH